MSRSPRTKGSPKNLKYLQKEYEGYPHSTEKLKMKKSSLSRANRKSQSPDPASTSRPTGIPDDLPDIVSSSVTAPRHQRHSHPEYRIPAPFPRFHQARHSYSTATTLIPFSPLLAPIAVSDIPLSPPPNIVITAIQPPRFDPGRMNTPVQPQLPVVPTGSIPERWNADKLIQTWKPKVQETRSRSIVPLELYSELADIATDDFTLELLDAMHEADETLGLSVNILKSSGNKHGAGPVITAASPPKDIDTKSARSESPIHPYFKKNPEKIPYQANFWTAEAFAKRER
ncbi:hypothetical protein JTB14_009034 [Gonioctena quinquepunctata]|nr:hypothetical protein JTB14_009034 [Gonioctena quinquepunctata]